MSDPGPDHARFDELAAGYVLHALEEDEERRFLSHVRHCPFCQQALAGYADVTAALAETASSAEPSPQLGSRILAAALARDPRPDLRGADPEAARPDAQPAPDRPGPDTNVVPLRSPRPRWLKAAAGAAAAALIAVGTWAGLAASHGAGTPPPSAACGHPSACTQVPLTEVVTHQTVARVIVVGRSVWLLPAGLPADDAARQIYVLWQITAAHAPLPVGSFDIRPGADKPIWIGPLAAPYHSAQVFAISLEPGRAIPASPSHVLALGQLPA